MTTSEQIRVLCVRTGVSLSELARRINQTPQNFNAKLKRNTKPRTNLIRLQRLWMLHTNNTLFWATANSSSKKGLYYD